MPLIGFLASMLGVFLFVAWFWVLITILSDIFRDNGMSGSTKARRFCP